MEKNIEIPFGAFDSVLGGWEYTIPEGFEAVVEDGKVIVRKVESEDDKIRKKIINLIEEVGEDDNYHVYCFDDMLSWLEKQGEQKPAYSEEMIEVIKNKEYAKGFDDGYNNAKQPQQEWSEEEEKMFKLTENLLLVTDSNLSANLNGRITPLADGEYSSLKFQIAQSISWLRIIKDRVQPKQEWSEKDDRILDNIETYIGIASRDPHSRDECVKEAIDWLKSLRPQKQWKPSDEQMEYLSKAILTLGDEGDCKTASILNELRTNLKKLKG